MSDTVLSPAPAPVAAAAATPLVVDVDGTLLLTDLLYESVVLLLRRRPWRLFWLPFWLMAGKAKLKREIARRVQLDPATQPVNERLLAWLRGEREKGRVLALFSASDEGAVRRVADGHPGLFDVVAGSDGLTNLAGAAKLAAIEARFGPNFTYAGDSAADVVIWESCRSAVLVGRTARLRAILSANVNVVATFDTPPAGPKTWTRALRLHQWAKNALLFVPALLAGRLFEIHDLLVTGLGFLIFGLLASASYLVNDLLDLAADRQHRSKRHRPLASGALPVRSGLLAVPALGLIVGAASLAMPKSFMLVAGAYLVITLSYSLVLKRRAILDMLVLALLFTLRIVAGIAAIGTAMSPWLLAFSMFFFLSLASIKRYSECLVMGEEGKLSVAGRGYRAADTPWLMSMGAASGFCSMVIFFIFLTDSQSPMRHYATPEWLWLICGILGYWLGRAWLLAGRGEMHDDPVLFAVKDRLSLFLGLLCALAVSLAHFA